MYAIKAEIARMFGVSPPTVHSRVAGIEREIGKRYNRYAVCDKLISLAVYVDFEKYHKRLEDKNLRKSVPAFNMAEARKYLEDLNGLSEKMEEQNKEKSKESNAIIIISVDDKKMLEYIRSEFRYSNDTNNLKRE